MYRSPNIARVIKSRRLRWSGHVARIEEGRRALKMLTGKPTGDIGVGGKTILEIGINMRNFFDSVQDRDYRRAPVNATLKLRVP